MPIAVLLVGVVSLVGIISYGLYRARGSRSMQAYLLAGRSMSWWVIGLSIMATQASAITFIGTTGQGYSDGIRFVQFYFGLPIAMVVISAVAAPMFHRSGVYTAYEFLEKRFDSKTRTLTSLVFLIQRGLGVGLALYAPAVVLSVILGWPEGTTTAVMGLIVVAYTVAGGIKAVMWTDVQQMILNPLEGHPRKRRNIMDPTLEETVRELSALDGAFIVDREGILLSAGTYLDAPTQGITLRQGLGARHYSAASITNATKAVAVNPT